MKDVEELVMFLSEWGKKYNYSIIISNNDEEIINYININLSTKKIYIDSLENNEPIIYYC